MKTLRNLPLAIAFLATFVGSALLVQAWWSRTHTVYPSPANQSAFLRSYDPHAVIQPFHAHGSGNSATRSSGSGAGWESATHTASFMDTFTMASADKARLMEAVGVDLAHRLASNGARIVHQSGDPANGFHFDYIAGRSVGSIAVAPLMPGAVQRAAPLPPGIEDVCVAIAAREKWFVNPPAENPVFSALSPENPAYQCGRGNPPRTTVALAHQP